MKKISAAGAVNYSHQLACKSYDRGQFRHAKFNEDLMKKRYCFWKWWQHVQIVFSITGSSGQEETLQLGFECDNINIYQYPTYKKIFVCMSSI